MTRAPCLLDEPLMFHRHISESAPPYRRVNGGATDFVPQPEGLKLKQESTKRQKSGQRP
jgi:hypothetical protein